MNKFEKFKYPVFLIIIIAIWSLFGFTKTSIVDVQPDKFRVEVSDVFSCEISYDSIKSMTIQDMPEEGEIISGGSKRGIHYGKRHNRQWGEYTLCIAEKSKKCLVFDTTEDIYVISYESTQTTQSMYDAFVEFFNEHGYDININ
ncbi:MAG TPA: hypothetical protein GXZ52_03390 [Clostridiales bacterium]|nr:hypothetical protein [Clostridiales bacterium]